MVRDPSAAPWDRLIAPLAARIARAGLASEPTAWRTLGEAWIRRDLHARLHVGLWLLALAERMEEQRTGG